MNETGQLASMTYVATRQPLAGQLFTEIKRRIRAGELSPGDRLPTEKDLTATFQVSRTVVREAIARLSADGLVKARHGAGVYVSETARYEAFQITRDELSTFEDVRKLLELRLAVETEMAGLAAERRTDADIAALRGCLANIGADPVDPDSSVDADAELHSAIARAAGNEYYERFITFLGVRLVPKRSILLGDAASSGRLMASLHDEHLAIVEAIAAGDARAARSAARRHLANSLKRHARAAERARQTAVSSGK